MRRATSGYSLVELLLVFAIFSVLLGGLISFRPNTAKGSALGLAQEVAGEFERASQQAVAKKVPVALVFPRTSPGSFSRSAYLLEGEVSPKVVREKTWERQDYRDFGIVHAHWGAATAGVTEHNLPSDGFDFTAWGAPEPNHVHFVFLPSGEVYSNHPVTNDGAYQVVVAAGYTGSPATVGGAPSFRLDSTGPAATISLSPLGAIQVNPGLTGGSGLVVASRMALPDDIAVLPTIATPDNRPPEILSLEVSPLPNPETLNPLVDATVDLEGYLTLTLRAREPDGDRLTALLYSEHLSGAGAKPGQSTSAQDIHLDWDGDAWKGQVHWQVPDDADVGSKYEVSCEVIDPDGLKDRRQIGVHGTVEVLAPGKILFQTVQGQLSIMNDDGTEVEPLISSAAISSRASQLSPDRTRVAFAGHGGGFPSGIYVVNVDGTELRRISPLPSVPNQTFDSPYWSEDGSEVFAFRNNHTPPPFYEFATVRLDPEGIAPPQVLFDGTTHYTGPPGQAPNTLVAVHAGIHEVDYSGNVVHTLRSSGIWMGIPRWSPDRSHVVFMEGFRDGSRHLILASYDEASNTILGPETNLTAPLGKMAGLYNWGDWSPAGGSIIYESNDGGWGIFRADVNTSTGTLSNEVRLGPGRSPTWVQVGR